MQASSGFYSGGEQHAHEKAPSSTKHRIDILCLTILVSWLYM